MLFVCSYLWRLIIFLLVRKDKANFFMLNLRHSAISCVIKMSYYDVYQQHNAIMQLDTRHNNDALAIMA